MSKRFYITTPIYYASGKPHLGHAYTTILADVLAKYKSKIGYEVFFQTGMDEHGQKIEDLAFKNNLTPKQFVDQNSKHFLELWSKLDINFSNFARTSSESHKKIVAEVFSQFVREGHIKLGTWKGLYCVGCEENYAQSRAHKGDDGKLYCEVGHELTIKNEESYFFLMSEFHEWIKNFFEERPDFITPQHRIKELQNSFLGEELEDLSVSRTSFSWGVQINENSKHVVYVWLDALLNYIIGLGYGTLKDENFLKFWQSDETEIVHLMSKEITRFHCIYWPIFLKCLNLRQPSKVISHGWIVTREGKMSKSLGNVVDPHEYINEFGSDAFRYFLMKEISIDNDGVFDRDIFIEKFNSDLANNYGNLVSRTLGMLEKYSSNQIKKGSVELLPNDIELCTAIKKTIITFLSSVNELNVNKILDTVIELGHAANKYIETTKPWVLAKENKHEEINNFLFCLSNAVRTMTSLLEPTIPNATSKTASYFNFNKTQLSFDKLLDFDLINENVVFKGPALFERIK